MNFFNIYLPKSKDCSLLYKINNAKIIKHGFDIIMAIPVINTIYLLLNRRFMAALSSVLIAAFVIDLLVIKSTIGNRFIFQLGPVPFIVYYLYSIYLYHVTNVSLMHDKKMEFVGSFSGANSGEALKKCMMQLGVDEIGEVK